MKDVLLTGKAILSNVLAITSPKLYVTLTKQTGRGESKETAASIAHYFQSCVDDYRSQLGLSEIEFEKFLAGKTILEYGPGDTLGVALLFYAHGAEQIHCVDRFPLNTLSDSSVAIYQQLIKSLTGEARKRAELAFNEPGNPRSGLNPKAIRYLVTRNGLANANAAYDLIISRAVLEHVNDLNSTMRDIHCSLKPDGISLHQVDLKSHGLDRYTEFDFLTWPRPVFRLMYSHKGFPNRWRVNKYRECAQFAGLIIKNVTPTGILEQRKVETIYKHLSRELTDVSPMELAWVGFWIRLEKSVTSDSAL